MARRLLPLVLLAVLGAGCGRAGGSSPTFTGEERAVADAVGDLGDAARDRDARRVCRFILAPAVARRLGDCERAVNQAFDATDQFAVTVEDVTVVGPTTARARVRPGNEKGADRVIGLTKGVDGWRISDLGRRVA